MSVILMYHSIASNPLDHGIQLRPETFQNHLDWLAAKKYKWCTVEQAIDAPHGNKVAITFDDGFKDNLPAFDVLNQKEIPATLYLCPDHVGKKSSWTTNPMVRHLPLLELDQVYRLSKTNIEIGSHCWNHRSFHKINSTQLDAALTLSTEWFQKHLGFTPKSLAFPYGHCPPSLLKVVQSHFDIALAVEPLPDMPFRHSVPRMPALEDLSQEAFYAHLRRYDLSNFVDP